MPFQEATPMERLVRTIMALAGPELERRRLARGVAQSLLRWRRRIMAGAAGLAVAAIGAILILETPGPSQGNEDVGLVEAVLPTAIAAWLYGEYELEPFEVLTVVNEAPPR